MTRMFRALIAAWLIAAAPPVTGATKPARVAPVAPQELARIWDAEHVSPPLPPLLEHDEVERRLQAVSQVDPSRLIFEKVLSRNIPALLTTISIRPQRSLATATID